jgi:hypothetical protein
MIAFLENNMSSASGPTPSSTVEQKKPESPAGPAPSQEPNGSKGFVAKSEQSLKRIGRETREELKKPTFAAAIVGAVVVGAAVVWGAAEAAVGAVAAYVVYRILRQRSAS